MIGKIQKWGNSNGIRIPKQLLAIASLQEGEDGLEANRGECMSQLMEIDDKLIALNELFHTVPQVQTVFLFGSYGTEHQTPLSDIDFAVFFRENITISEEADLLNKLSITLDTDLVDLVNLNKAPLIIQFNVIAEGKIIYERDYIATCDFIEKVIKYYQDYAIRLNQFNRDYDQSFREVYTDGK